MVTRRFAVQNLSGPMGNSPEGTSTAWLSSSRAGTRPMIRPHGSPIISLNLGIFNLYSPIPILDGGVIVLLLIEGVLRRADLNQEFKERIYQAAFVVLLIFAAFVMSTTSKLSVLHQAQAVSSGR